MAGKRSGKANAICDRSGGKYPMSKMVIEPGTGYLVHRSLSDGKWNLVDHPLNHIMDYVQLGDPFPIDNARPDRSYVLDLFLTNEDSEEITTEAEQNIMVT